MIVRLLSRARSLTARGDDEAARQAYLDAVRLDPAHPEALIGLGALARAGGYISAARSVYEQAVRCHPGDPVARVGYADLLSEAGDPRAACGHYRVALSIDPDMPHAHQGLARALTAIGKPAGAHLEKGFRGHAVARQRYRGAGSGIPLLLLVSAIGGNVPVRTWIDDRIFAVTAVFADFHDHDPLPPHALIVNAVGDADLCEAALIGAERIVARGGAEVINPPSLVRTTGRHAIARRLAGISGVIAPRVEKMCRAQTTFPLLLRASGYHTGQHFIRIETAAGLAEAVAALPDPDPLAIEYLDARGPDGMARKYRVMFIDGAVYPLHLAISADWKVHYFSAAMEHEPACRAEEQRFLESMPSVLGPRAMAALADIQAALGLDYAGIDFALAGDGSVLLFEANATMVIAPPGPGPIWDYRRPAMTAALNAAKRMLLRRSICGKPANG